jgi:hypothetical protein
MAEKGLSIPQMKAISGHNSDTVLQQYIDQSDKLKSVGENALAIGNPVKNSPNKTDTIIPAESTTTPLAPAAINKNFINFKLVNTTVTGNIIIQVR